MKKREDVMIKKRVIYGIFENGSGDRPLIHMQAIDASHTAKSTACKFANSF